MSNAQEVIARILADKRQRGGSHFSGTVYGDEPIIMTGRQMASFLPGRYREMRAISRWQPGESRGRWLSEAELFCLQGDFMADAVDDCPYHGAFKSYYPTYTAMSDRQLRGYFTWRTAVRADRVEETSLSFAFVYLYELINGVGVTSPLEAFSRFEAFWRAYRVFDPDIDRYARVWLQDLIVYHELDRRLLAGSRTVAFDQALAQLDRAVVEPLCLPPDAEREERLIEAIDALSSYRIKSSRLYRSNPDDLRRVACAVLARLVEHHERRCKLSLVDTLFDGAVDRPHLMFSSAMFFERRTHPDARFELDEIQSYRCEGGLWRCTRRHGGRSRSTKLGRIMHAVDRGLRLALDPAHPLREEAAPKYLLKTIDQEIARWLAWRRAHAPRVIEIDLSKLADIRAAAAEVREALLVDEEREGALAPGPPRTARTPVRARRPDAASERAPSGDMGARASVVPNAVASAIESARPLSASERAWLRALLDRDDAARAAAAAAAGASQDMIVDAINEKLLELIGDTVIEHDEGAPHVICDYESDLREIIRT